MNNFGKGMWKNQFGKEVQNRSWRKLFYKSQIGVSALQILNYKRNSEGKACSIGSSICSLKKKRNIQASWVQYTYGRLVMSLFSPKLFQLLLCQCFSAPKRTWKLSAYSLAYYLLDFVYPEGHLLIKYTFLTSRGDKNRISYLKITFTLMLVDQILTTVA